MYNKKITYANIFMFSFLYCYLRLIFGLSSAKMNVKIMSEIQQFSNKIRIYLGMSENCCIFAGQ